MQHQKLFCHRIQGRKWHVIVQESVWNETGKRVKMTKKTEIQKLKLIKHNLKKST